MVELLAYRSAGTAADWFKRHPEIEVVSRDRAGLYADAARQGAPQARQVADRFHLLKNFQETVERQLGRFEAPIRASAVEVEDDPDTREQPGIERSVGCSEVAANERLLRRGRDAARKAMFDEIRALYEAGSPVTAIARKLGLGPGGSIDGCVASTCRSPAPWSRRFARRPISELSWHAVGPRGRPKSGIYSLISVIEATPARLATWRASSLRGAAAVPPREKRVSRLHRTRKPQHRRTCEPRTRRRGVRSRR